MTLEIVRTAIAFSCLRRTKRALAFGGRIVDLHMARKTSGSTDGCATHLAGRRSLPGCLLQRHMAAVHVGDAVEELLISLPNSTRISI
jgi:hypothetical protein